MARFGAYRATEKPREFLWVLFMNYAYSLTKAMCEVIREAISYYSANSSAGDGTIHLKLSFRVSDPGVTVPDYLRESYQNLVPIVLRNRFRNLKANLDSFSVYLYLQNGESEVTIPYSSIVDYVDVIAGFSLGFNHNKPDSNGCGTMELIALFKNDKKHALRLSEHFQEQEKSLPKNVILFKDFINNQKNN